MKLPGLGAAFLLAIGLAAPAHSSVFVVNTGEDKPDPVIDGNCAVNTSQGTRCSLRAAVMEANQSVGPDTIWIDPSVTSLSLTVLGGPIDADSVGDLDITSDIGIFGPDPQLSGSFPAGLASSLIRPRITVAGAGDRVFDVHTGGSLALKYVELVGGTVPAAGSRGGCLWIEDGASATVERTSISQCYANGSGGAVSVGSGASPGATLVASDLAISTSQALTGGGMALDQYSTATVTDAMFSGNGVSPVGNTAPYGGGVYLNIFSNLTANRITFDGNAAFALGTSGLTGQGGGVYTLIAATANLTNCTITNNEAGQSGGAIYNVGSYFLPAVTNLNNCTVAGNTTFTGGAPNLFGGVNQVSGSVKLGLLNSIVHDSCGGAAGTVISLGHNVLSTNCVTAISPTGPGDTIADDPKFIAYGANDAGLPPVAAGEVRPKTYSIQADSPAVDTGDNATCDPFDARGVARPVGSNCDRGAFEGPICGDGVVQSPELCDGGSGCLPNCTIAAPDNNVPDVQNNFKLQGQLVKAYGDCLTQNFVNFDSGMPGGCVIAPLDPGCQFQDGVGKGTVSLTTTASGQITVALSLTKLASSCNGKTLRLRLAFNETVKSCGTSSSPSSCTLETDRIDTDLVPQAALTCLVPTSGSSAGSCTINTTINATSYPSLVNGQRTSLELRAAEVYRTDNPNSGQPTFRLGLRVN